MRFIAGLIVILAGAVSLSAQHGGLAKNPYDSEQDVAAGGRIFRSHCAVCHGLGGAGGSAKNLTTGEFRHGSADPDLYNTISNGIPGTEMPGIFFNGKQMWQLVGYVRSLSRGEAREVAEGSAVRGREIFAGKGACGACHMVNGEGARGGPDLSDIGAQRSYAHLRESLLDPNAKVLPKHWRVTAVTKGGRTISGVRLNEDTHSIQLLDGNENLVSLLKSDLREHKISKESVMPTYQGRLSDSELDDLIGYLSTLKRRRSTE